MFQRTSHIISRTRAVTHAGRPWERAPFPFYWSERGSEREGAGGKG